MVPDARLLMELMSCARWVVQRRMRLKKIPTTGISKLEEETLCRPWSQ